MSWATLHAALAAYAPRALGRGAYADAATGLCCALGAVAPELRPFAASRSTSNVTVDLAEAYRARDAAMARLGLSDDEARALIVANDGGAPGETAAARYARVLAYVAAKAAGT